MTYATLRKVANAMLLGNTACKRYADFIKGRFVQAGVTSMNANMQVEGYENLYFLIRHTADKPSESFGLTLTISSDLPAIILLDQFT